jgi:hypothetical protein
MKTTAVLAGALGCCAWGCVNVHTDQPHTAPPYTEIYRRETNVFADAEFFKPAETKTNELTFTLAPLILQQVNVGKEPFSQPDGFGTLNVSNATPVLDGSRTAVYWEADIVQIRGNAHARFSYVWCYSAGLYESKRGQGRNSVSPGQAESGLPLQGIRITLNAAGQPVIWEVLADSSGAELLFVSQTLEAAALAEFGKPLPGRRHAIERSVEEAPNAIVARVIDNGPVAMGPIVYLSAGTRAVSTLICRCMPAQARRLLATGTYELVPFQSGATGSFLTLARELSNERTTFWPGEHPGEERLEKCLRLPGAFSDSQGTSRR